MPMSGMQLQNHGPAGKKKQIMLPISDETAVALQMARTEMTYPTALNSACFVKLVFSYMNTIYFMFQKVGLEFVLHIQGGVILISH